MPRKNYAAWHKEVLADRIRTASAEICDEIDAALAANGHGETGMLRRLVALRKLALAGAVEAAEVETHAFAVVHGNTALATARRDPKFRAVKDAELAATLERLTPQYTEDEKGGS